MDYDVHALPEQRTERERESDNVMGNWLKHSKDRDGDRANRSNHTLKKTSISRNQRQAKGTADKRQ
jgi:hypothetical protein